MIHQWLCVLVLIAPTSSFNGFGVFRFCGLSYSRELVCMDLRVKSDFPEIESTIVSG